MYYSREKVGKCLINGMIIYVPYQGKWEKSENHTKI